MKVLVTGAAGFIGSQTAARLLRDGHEVTGADNLNDYYDPTLKLDRLAELAAYPGFVFEKVELSEEASALQLFEGRRFDRVVHLAAQAGVRHSLNHPQAYIQSNLAGFANVLEGCRRSGVGHLLYASSSSVYGSGAEVPFREDEPADRPVSLYAATKRSNELLAHTYSHLYGMPATGMRLFTVYGPWGRPDMAYFSFTRRIMAGEPIELFNGGAMRRDFTYIDDIVEGIVRLVDTIPEPNGGVPYRLFNIGSSRPVELMRMVHILERALGRMADLRSLPMQPGEVVETYADVRALREAVGFSPATTIEDGLERFVDWYRSYYRV